MQIAFYKAKNGKLLDRVINVWTGCHGYSHTEIVFDKIYPHNNGEYLCCSADGRTNSVRFKNIDVKSFHWVLIDIPEIDTIEKEQEVYQLMRSFKGAKYDWYGIFCSFVFAFNKQDDKKWWCSELCAYVLNKYVDSSLKFRISPNKLAKELNCPKVPFGG